MALLVGSVYATSQALGISQFVVQGRSMVPKLHPGDLVITRKVSPADIEIGDIIVYKLPESEKLIIHEVVNKITNGEVKFRTKGVNNPAPDPWLISYNNVIGEVIYSIPQVGYLRLILGFPIHKIPVGIWLVIVILLALMVVEATKER